MSLAEFMRVQFFCLRKMHIRNYTMINQGIMIVIYYEGWVTDVDIK